MHFKQGDRAMPARSRLLKTANDMVAAVWVFREANIGQFKLYSRIS